ncbi:MAG: DNA polymerase III subunit alpha, partial [Actinomycetota bacterium]|nr:DNA polymerase III subunit alpha [Actinomycetota bacterium]
MPDIDIDFDERKRGDVIRYVQSRYGEDRVAQIVTYGTIKGKQAIKDAARVLGHPYAEGDRLCKMYPPLIMGRDSGLQSALESSPELRDAYAAGGAAKEIIDTALKIENLKRSAGIHAAGVVIGRDALEEHLPLRRGDHGEVVTQFDMKGVEKLGLLKMDFLGLRNLTVIDLTRDYVKANRGVDIDVDNLDLADPKVFEMLSRGDTDGIFQLESEGMRRYLKQLKPTRFEHIMAMVALYRPGPMDQIPTYVERMHNPDKITFLHPALEEMTKETFGVLVYQEQIVQTLQIVAGYSPGQADIVRKAIGKKDRAIMAAEKPRFIEGCTNGGLAVAQAQHLWGLIERFADYSFNRAHAACYAYVAYQTAWLKAHYPVEYMAALLTSVKDDKDAKPFYLAAARRMKVDVLIPDVNSSDVDFTPVGDAIRFGLSAVRGIGENVVAKIIEARSTGPFESFHDFCRRVDPICVNKRVIESLIKAGAFESLGHTRMGLLEGYEPVVQGVMTHRRNQELGWGTLWGDDPGVVGGDDHDVPIPIQEYEKKILLAHEKEALGLYVSDHPLLGIEGLLARMCDCTIASLDGRPAGDVVTIGGLVATYQKKMTKRGDIMVLLGLEDLSGAAVEVVVFAKTYQSYQSLLRPDAILLVKGRVDRDARDDSVKFLAMEFHEPNLGEELPLVINLQHDSLTPHTVDTLKEILGAHPGSTQVFLHIA